MTSLEHAPASERAKIQKSIDELIGKANKVTVKLYNDDKETLERWHEHLSTLLGYKFEIKEDQEKTLETWSKLIGG